MSAPHAPPRRDTPFRILILADLSGRGGRGTPPDPAAIGAPRRVDRDDFGTLLERLEPSIRLDLPDGTGVLLRFRGLDDFHPDRLVLRIDTLLHLRGLRDRLRNPGTFAEAAAEAEALLGTAEEGSGDRAAPDSDAAPADPATLTSEDLLGAALRITASGAADSDDDADRIVHEAIAPHMASVRRDRPTRAQAEAVAAVEALMGDLLREVLHHPRFQALEATWRSLHDLVRRTETGTALQIHVLDASRDEVYADLTSAPSLEQSRLYRHVVEATVETAGGERWAVVASDHAFDSVPADVLLLSKLARLAESAGCTFVATARPGIVGCASLGSAPRPSEWNEEGDAVGRKAFAILRSTPAARHAALLWPRLLLRLPYGRDTDATEDVPFEERPAAGGPAEHEHYLWGGGAFLLAAALGERFDASGWKLRAGQALERAGLPAHVVVIDDEQRLQPCAEALLTDRGVERIVEAGLVPLVSVRGQNVVRSGRLHPLAGRDVPLAGPWSR